MLHWITEFLIIRVCGTMVLLRDGVDIAWKEKKHPVLQHIYWTMTQDLTAGVAVKVQVGVGLPASLHGISQFVFLQLCVEGAVGPVGEGRAAGLQAAAGALGVCSPPPVLHHQQTLVWAPHWDDTEKENCTSVFLKWHLSDPASVQIWLSLCAFYVLSD